MNTRFCERMLLKLNSICLLLHAYITFANLKVCHGSVLLLISSCLSNIRMLMTQFLQRNSRIFAMCVCIPVAGIPFQLVLCGINSKTRSRDGHLTFVWTEDACCFMALEQNLGEFPLLL